MRTGEVFSLEWKQVNLTEGKLYLNAQDTKTDTPRVLYLTGDLLRVLATWKERCESKWPACPWICHYGGVRLERLRRSWRTACTRVGLGQMVFDPEKGRRVWEGKIPHDFRRTAIRNVLRAGVPEKIAMAISGHKTRSVFDRYNIVNETDLAKAVKSLSDYFEREKQASVGTLAESAGEARREEEDELVGIAEGNMEPAIRIERTTCGLRNIHVRTLTRGNHNILWK
jgi:integrase